MSSVKLSHETIQEDWSDYNFVMQRVKEDGNYLQHASAELRDNREVVMEAVKQNALALSCASQLSLTLY